MDRGLIYLEYLAIDKGDVFMQISLNLALVLCLVMPVLAKPPAEAAFDEWLDAFNELTVPGSLPR